MARPGLGVGAKTPREGGLLGLADWRGWADYWDERITSCGRIYGDGFQGGGRGEGVAYNLAGMSKTLAPRFIPNRIAARVAPSPSQ